MKFKSGLHPLLLSICFLFMYSHSHAQCCTYTLSMQDTYGDGWNGGFLTIYVNNNLLGNFYGQGWASSETFEWCKDDSIRFVYTIGMYENENFYELYGPGFGLIAARGPNLIEGVNLMTVVKCDTTFRPGNHPCTALPLDTVSCVLGDNTEYEGSGLSPFCADYKGGDMWFVIKAAPSGNMSFQTDSGSLNDTGLAIWASVDTACSDLRLLACDDDAGNDAFSFITLYELKPNQNLFVQVFGYGGGEGTFKLCAKDLGVFRLDSSNLPIVTIRTLGQAIPNDAKIDAQMEIRYNGPDQTTYITDPPGVYNGKIGIEVRGASSSGYPQQPYGLETRNEDGTDLDVTLLGMPAESDWVLLSNFNDRSLIRNTLAFRLAQDMGHYSPRMQLCEVMLDSIYKGIYLFGEKIKRDSNRVNIAKLTTEDIEGDDVTGGYILQQNYWSPETSFQSNYSPIDHPGFDVHFVYEYPKPKDILEEQKTYIASYVDSLETALYSDDFTDPEIGYRKYLDVESFIDYFLVNELSRNNDGFKKSVFLYKDKFSNGGKLKAGPVWDFDWAWKNIWGCFTSEMTDGSQWAHHVNDCVTDNYGHGWYIRFLQDSSFTQELRCMYEEYRATIFDTNYLFAYIDSMGEALQQAQQRHFKKWPILGISGPAPEVLAVATTYEAELDTLKSWIVKRLNWLDVNIPGLCEITGIQDPQVEVDGFTFYPNPGNGTFYFENINNHDPVEWIEIFDAAGMRCLSKNLINKENGIEIDLIIPGLYFARVKTSNGRLFTKKLFVLPG